MAINDVYEFKLYSTYRDTIQCLNVFHYQSLGDSDVTVAMSIVASAFWDKLGVAIRNIASTTMNYRTVYVKNLNGETEGSFSIPSGVGGVGGDALPSFNAFSFLFRRSLTGVRHGHKRFAGVPESSQNEGIVTNTFRTTTIDPLVPLLGAPIDDDNGLNASASLFPVIYSQYLNGELRLTPEIVPVASVEFTGIGSQNTRKR